jgi:transposase
MSLVEVRRLAKTEKRSRIKVRYLAIHHFLEGKTRADIARYIKVARGSVNKWVNTYLNFGLDGLKDTTNPGRPAKLTPTQLKTLTAYVEKHGISDTGGRLQAKDVGEFIFTEFNVKYQNRNIYRLLHHLGFSWITSRSKHPKQDEEAQRLFKNLPSGNDP